LSSDVAEEEGVPLPQVEGIRAAITQYVPSADTLNPLDLIGRSKEMRGILDAYVSSDDIDAMVMLWMLDEHSRVFGESVVGPCVELAQQTDKPLILASLEESSLGSWAGELPERGLGVVRGVRPALRALKGMQQFAEARRRPPRVDVEARLRPRPANLELVETDVGPMLRFSDAMELLTSFGVPVAQHHVFGEDALEADIDGERVPFAGPYVVKLADVPHRTELGAVRLGVTGAELARAVLELRAVAEANGVAAAVAVQPMLESSGEAFMGLEADSEFGPMVVCGLGGIFVEVLKRVGGAIAPFGAAEADDILEAFADVGVFEGLRGARPWDREQLASIAVAMSDLAVATGDWLASVDVNPLLLGPDGFVAVDGLCVVRSTQDDAA
jgi:acyl-CoA synthetase (NDP forming)